MTVITLPTAAATIALGIRLGETLPAGSVLLLSGDLGSGKTTLVQGIGQGLGVHEPIDSPTFTLINEYTSGRIPLYHLDLYRLEPSQVAGLHPELYWDGVEVELGVMAIEWADRLPYYPTHYLELQIELQITSANYDARTVTISPHGDRSQLRALDGINLSKQ